MVQRTWNGKNMDDGTWNAIQNISFVFKVIIITDIITKQALSSGAEVRALIKNYKYLNEFPK